jgi:hypothetical protein
MADTADTAPKTVTVYHPDLADRTREVPAANVDAWTAQGWRKTPLP